MDDRACVLESHVLHLRERFGTLAIVRLGDQETYRSSREGNANILLPSVGGRYTVQALEGAGLRGAGAVAGGQALVGVLYVTNYRLKLVAYESCLRTHARPRLYARFECEN